jgi:hypothetical protein
MMVNNELEKMYKEVVVTYIKLVSRNVPGKTEENHEDSDNSLCPG